MPVTSMPVTSTLSVIWTHQRLVSELRVITNELDNERVQDANIRNHVNVCLSNIAELLNLAKDPFYGVTWNATPDGNTPMPNINLNTKVSLLVNGSGWTTLNPSVSTFAPYALLWEVNRLGFTNAAGKLANAQRLSLEEIMHLNTGDNMQYQEAVAWHLHGGYLYLYVGGNITAPSAYYIFGFRNPILDDLQPPASSTTWTQAIDLPDRYARLLLLMGQKMVLEQVNKQVDPSIDAAINQTTQQITSSIVAETQYAEAMRQKKEYGLNTR